MNILCHYYFAFEKECGSNMLTKIFQGCFVPSLVEIQYWLNETSEDFFGSVISTFHCYLPLEKFAQNLISFGHQ